MKTLFIVVLILLIYTSCKKDNNNISTINGVWIESSHGKDTLYFNSSLSIVDLKMGEELRNGVLLPKTNSGLYMYEVKGDSISMQYSFSSFYNPRKYSFNVDQKRNRITIGSFYINSLSINTPVNFTKIK